MYTNRVFGTAKRVLFIKVSSFQGALIKNEFHHHSSCLVYIYMYTCRCGI